MQSNLLRFALLYWWLQGRLCCTHSLLHVLLDSAWTLLLTHPHSFAEVASALEANSVRPQDLRDDTPSTAQASVTQLRSKTFGQVHQVRAAVDSVKQHVRRSHL